MYHFAAAITLKALTVAGELARFFSPFPIATHPEGGRIFGLLVEVPTSVTADFVVDVKKNGTSIYIDNAHRPTVPGATTRRLIMIDIRPPDTTGIVIADAFDKITVDAITVPSGGLPSGVKIAVVFNDLLNIVANDIVDGVFNPDRLAAGVRDGSKFLRDDGTWQAVAGGGVTDHGALTGLGDDDHPQYQLRSERNAANGYAGLDGAGLLPDASIPSGIARDTEVAAAVATHEAASDPHPQYLTEAEGSALYAPIGGGGGANAAVNALVGWGSSITGATQDATTNALTKTAASGWGNSGAFGVGAFPVAKGMVLKYLADPAGGASSAISVGITAAAADQSQSYDTADYSFISYTGGWTIYEDGVEKYNVNANTAYNKGEEFEIRMSVDGIVSYWFNGVLKYISATIAAGTYHADVAISAIGGRVPPVITRADVQ